MNTFSLCYVSRKTNWKLKILQLNKPKALEALIIYCFLPNTQLFSCCKASMSKPKHFQIWKFQYHSNAEPLTGLKLKRNVITLWPVLSLEDFYHIFLIFQVPLWGGGIEKMRKPAYVLYFCMWWVNNREVNDSEFGWLKGLSFLDYFCMKW